jgi:hypothetical protein
MPSHCKVIFDWSHYICLLPSVQVNSKFVFPELQWTSKSWRARILPSFMSSIHLYFFINWNNFQILFGRLHPSVESVVRTGL